VPGVVRLAAGSILTDPSDLDWSDDFADEHGIPDRDKIIAAAEDLARRKPHYAKVRGYVGQGEHSPLDEPTVSFVDMLRG
jgi:hypothetical protein